MGVLCLSLFGMHYFVSFLVCNHLEEEERAGCFAFVVLLYMFCGSSVTVSWVGQQRVIVVFPDHTYFFFI